MITLPTSFDKLDTNALNKIPVRTRWERRKKAERRFFLRWQNEYLNVLKERTHNLHQTKEFERGDVVLLINERRNRLAWPLARVVETYPSRDGRVRSVLLRRGIQLKDKDIKPNSTPKFIKRGVENFALFESAGEETPIQEEAIDEATPTEN